MRLSRPHLIAILSIGAVAIIATSLWRAQQSLHESTGAVRRESELTFTLKTLQGGSLPDVEHIASKSSFLDAVSFQEKLWILSADRLMASDGSATYRCGAELPAAPLVSMVSGVAGGSREPELFIATAGAGVLIFDGRSIRQLLPANAAKVSALLPLGSGELLIGTEKAGVLAWDGSRLGWFHDSLKNLPVTAMAGSLDSLWVGTLDRGAVHLHAGQADVHRELPDRHVLSLAADGERAYVGMSVGIAEFTGGKMERLLGDGLFARALWAGDGRLNVGTLEEGLFELPLVTRQPRMGRSIGAVAEGEAAAVHQRLAVMKDRLLVREGAVWRVADVSTGGVLSDRNIAALAIEDAGRVWVGYFDHGLDILDNNRVTHVEDEHVFCVNRIVPSGDGAAVATANGLVILDRAGTTRRLLTRDEGLIASHVTDVLADKDGIVAATSAGLTFLTGGTPQSIYAFHGLVNNHVYTLARSGKMLMAGTLGGASVLEGGVVKASFTTANSALRHNWISAAVAVGEDIFAGTYGAGVFRFDGSAWHGFADLRAGFEVNPNAMAATQSAVFAGSLTKGLAIYNRANGRWAFHTAGLPSLNVTAVAIGGGSIYVGTDNGLVRFGERSIALP